MITSSLCYKKIEEARETLFQPNRPFKKQIHNLVVLHGLELEKGKKNPLKIPFIQPLSPDFAQTDHL